MKDYAAPPSRFAYIPVTLEGMTNTEAMKIIHDFTEQRIRMGEEKGKSYANDEADRLANFKALAADLGSTPEQVLMTYKKKHDRSTDHWVKSGAEPDFDCDVHSDGIIGRLADIANYIDLLVVMIHEKMALRRSQEHENRMEHQR